MQIPLILIVNDDGINAPGIRKLISIMNDFGDVVVVAPDGPQSGKGHAITIEDTIRCDKVKIDDGPQEEYSSSGTPVDCVKLAGRKASKWALTTHPKTLNMLQNLQGNIKRQDKVNIIIQFLENDFTDREYQNWKSNFVENYQPEFITREEERKFMKCLQLSLASDAFFPFRDNIDKCSQFGVKYILQPGGSLSDSNIIDACNDYGILMCMSGVRVFTH